MSKNKAQIARELYASKTYTVSEICKTPGIAWATFYRYVKAEQTDEEDERDNIRRWSRELVVRNQVDK